MTGLARGITWGRKYRCRMASPRPYGRRSRRRSKRTHSRRSIGRPQLVTRKQPVGTVPCGTNVGIPDQRGSADVHPERGSRSSSRQVSKRPPATNLAYFWIAAPSIYHWECARQRHSICSIRVWSLRWEGRHSCGSQEAATLSVGFQPDPAWKYLSQYALRNLCALSQSFPAFA
jgi:hypothetical protein